MAKCVQKSVGREEERSGTGAGSMGCVSKHQVDRTAVGGVMAAVAAVVVLLLCASVCGASGAATAPLTPLTVFVLPHSHDDVGTCHVRCVVCMCTHAGCLGCGVGVGVGV